MMKYPGIMAAQAVPALLSRGAEEGAVSGMEPWEGVPYRSCGRGRRIRPTMQGRISQLLASHLLLTVSSLGQSQGSPGDPSCRDQSFQAPSREEKSRVMVLESQKA